MTGLEWFWLIAQIILVKYNSNFRAQLRTECKGKQGLGKVNIQDNFYFDDITRIPFSNAKIKDLRNKNGYLTKSLLLSGYLSQYYGSGGGSMAASSMASQFMASSGMMYAGSGSSGGGFNGNPPPSLSPIPYSAYGGSNSVTQSTASIIGAMT